MLGLVAGLGWWTSPLIVVYLVPFAVLALRTGLVWRPRIGLFPVGFLLGGLPAWLYELRNFPSARFALHAAGGVPVALFHDRVTAVAGTFLPTLLGLHLESGRPWLVIFLLVAVPLWAAALIGAVSGAGPSWPGCSGGEGSSGAGRSSSGSSPARILALVLATKRAIDHYYLLPLYSVLPCWMGDLLDPLRRRGRWLAGAALVSLVALNGWANWHDSVRRLGAPRWTALERRVRAALAGWRTAG